MALTVPAVPSTPIRTLVLPFLVIAGAVAFALPNPEHPWLPWLLGLTFAPLVLRPNSKAWTLAPILIGELWLGSYMLVEFGLSLRLLTALAALALALPLILRLRRAGDAGALSRVVIPAVALVVIATLVNILFSESDYVIKYLRYQVVQVLGLLVAAAVLSSRRDLKRLALLALVAGLFAAVASVWQHFSTQSAIYGDATAASVRDWKGRTVGLTASPVTLANQLTFVLVPLLGVLAAGPWRRDRPRLLLLAAMLVVFAGLNFTYTRSAFFALGPGLLVIGLYVGGRRRTVVLGSLVAAWLLFVSLEGTGLIGSRYYSDAEDDRSAASHEALWEVGFAVAVDNSLLGVGHEHFEEISVEYLDVLDERANALGGSDSIGKERPHNDWLSVWSSWGILSLAAYAAIFVGALRNLAIAARNRDPLVRGIAVGLAGWLATYGVNSAYHNYMDSSIFLWLCAGLSVALARLPVHRGQAAARVWSRAHHASRRTFPRYGEGYV